LKSFTKKWNLAQAEHKENDVIGGKRRENSGGMEEKYLPSSSYEGLSHEKNSSCVREPGNGRRFKERKIKLETTVQNPGLKREARVHR